jgi:ubiquinone/menaquinone biosynthesis C-methylase UbiE
MPEGRAAAGRGRVAVCPKAAPRQARQVVRSGEMATDFKERSRVAFDRQAADYDTKQYGRHARWLQPEVLEEVHRLEPLSLLDVGCGTGALLDAFLKSADWADAGGGEAAPAIEVFGIDLSPQMLALARRRLGERAQLQVADAEALPLDDDAVDVTVCVDSFHHYPRPDVALAEMRRVTRSGGTVIVADWHVGAPGRQLMNAIVPHVPGGDVRIYSEREMRDLAAAAGFSRLRWRKAARRAQMLVCTV